MDSSTIPLNKLLISPRNVRKTYADEDIDSLACSIHSKGLLQNLVVSASPTGRGFHEVDAGGRRWRALNRLVEQKLLQRNWPVPVKIVPHDDAAEASLAENLQKIALNPADEVLAFRAIIERYEDNGIVDRSEQIENLARRFGVTVRYVEQRLRLAALAPEILDALRTGGITLDAAKSYAAVSDQALQMKVFAGQEKLGSDRHRAAAIRAAFAGKVYRRADKIARYVGIDAYTAAGGRLDVDLFMGSEDEEVLLDTVLVDRLAKEKAEAEADRIAQAAGFVAGLYSPLTAQYTQWPKAPAGYQTHVTRSEGQSAEAKAEAIAIAELAADGSSLQPTGYCFRKVAEPSPASSARGVESEIARLARIRRERIRDRAARLAVPPLANTPLSGRAFWPAPEADYIDAVAEDAEGNFIVAMLVKVPKDEVENFLGLAELELDRAEAEREAAHAALAASADAAEDEQDEEDGVVGEAVE